MVEGGDFLSIKNYLKNWRWALLQHLISEKIFLQKPQNIFGIAKLRSIIFLLLLKN